VVSTTNPAPVALSIPDVKDVIPDVKDVVAEPKEPPRDADAVELREILEATAPTPESSTLASLTEPSPTVAPSVAQSGARYWVQVGAFKNVQTATELASRLLGDYWSVGLVPGQSLTRVRVGPFAHRAEAVFTLRALTLRGFRPFLHEDPSL
jgi:cell division septation protein DedD